MTPKTTKPKTQLLLAEAEGRLEEYLQKHPEDQLHVGKDITEPIGMSQINAYLRCKKCKNTPKIFISVMVKHTRRKMERETVPVCEEHGRTLLDSNKGWTHE